MTNARVGRPKGRDEENTNRRRKQLIDAAIESIVEHGLSTTTFETIAKAAGLSKGTAVFYFKTKDALLFEAFRHRIEEYQANWKEALAAAGCDPVDQVVALVFASLDPKVMTRQNLAFWVSFWPEASRSESLRLMSRKDDKAWYDAVLSSCEAADQYACGPDWTPRAVANALQLICDGAWDRVHYSPSMLSRRDASLAAGVLLSTIYPSRAHAIMKRAKDD